MPRALIAGGGIAGLAAAVALTRAGWQAEVHERAPDLGEVGAGLQISPNACRVLNWLGLLEDVEAVAFRPANAVLRDGLSGRTVYRAPLGPHATERWGAPYLHVHRADLLRVLEAAARHAGVVIHLGRSVERSVEHPDSVAVHLSDGEIVTGDMVLGADGVRSALRERMHPAEAPRFTGQVAWRALVPASLVPDGTVPRDATVWAGPGRHLVTYYLRGGDLINLVGVREVRDWTAEGWSVAGDPADLRAAFDGWDARVCTLLEAVEDCFLWGLFDRPEQVRWTTGRLALIGDAAHPMLPFMAQGAAQALEDVAALIRHLRGTSIPDALGAWEDERWARVVKVIARSKTNGRLFHQDAGPGRALSRGVINLVSRMAPGLAAGRLDWLYGFDPVRGP